MTRKLGVNIFHDSDKKEKNSEQKIELRTDLTTNISEEKEEEEEGKIFVDNKENQIEEDNEKKFGRKIRFTFS